MTLTDIRFATYNIQFGFGLDGAYDLERIAGAVSDADIICMQEVTTHWQACKFDHQPEVLASLLNRYAVYGPGYELDSSSMDAEGRVVNTRRGFGNAVLSRWPVSYSRIHALPRPVDDTVADTKTDLPRCALETVIDVPGVPLRVMSVHLSHQSRLQRLTQVAVLRALLHELPDESLIWKQPKSSQDPWSEGKLAPPVVVPTLLAGDFNFEPDDPEYGAMLASPNGPVIVDAWSIKNTAADRVRTCVESDGSRTTLDYVFMTSDLSGAVAGASVKNDREGSDHFPLVVDLDFSGATLPVPAPA
jgi:endonuclease/exonuclease/phosphatase family metal-dependent hydrolase